MVRLPEWPWPWFDQLPLGHPALPAHRIIEGVKLLGNSKLIFVLKWDDTLTISSFTGVDMFLKLIGIPLSQQSPLLQSGRLGTANPSMNIFHIPNCSPPKAYYMIYEIWDITFEIYMRDMRYEISRRQSFHEYLSNSKLFAAKYLLWYIRDIT